MNSILSDLKEVDSDDLKKITTKKLFSNHYNLLFFFSCHLSFYYV